MFSATISVKLLQKPYEFDRPSRVKLQDEAKGTKDTLMSKEIRDVGARKYAENLLNKLKAATSGYWSRRCVTVRAAAQRGIAFRINPFGSHEAVAWIVNSINPDKSNGVCYWDHTCPR